MNRLAKVVVVIGALAFMGGAGCSQEAPDPSKVHRDAGDLALGKSEWGKAAEAYGKALEIDPKQEKIWEKKAYAHMQAGETEPAEAAMLKLLDLRAEPAKKAEVYRNVASIHLQKNDKDKAERWFSEAVKVDPSDELSLGWLAEMYSQRGGARDMKAPIVPEQLDKAIETYDKLIAIKPDVSANYLSKRIAMGRYMEHERLQKEAADKEAKESKDKGKAEEAAARAAKHQARMDEFKTKFDEMTGKLKELAKNPQPAK